MLKDKLRRIWEEVLMTYSRLYGRLGVEKLRQTTVNFSYGNQCDGRHFEWASTKYSYIISLPHLHARSV